MKKDNMFKRDFIVDDNRIRLLVGTLIEKALQEQAKEHNNRIFVMQVKLEEAWTRSWDKRIGNLIRVLNRTHISDKHKLNAVRMSLNNLLKGGRE